MSIRFYLIPLTLISVLFASYSQASEKADEKFDKNKYREWVRGSVIKHKFKEYKKFEFTPIPFQASIGSQKLITTCVAHPTDETCAAFVLAAKSLFPDQTDMEEAMTSFKYSCFKSNQGEYVADSEACVSFRTLSNNLGMDSMYKNLNSKITKYYDELFFGKQLPSPMVTQEFLYQLNAINEGDCSEDRMEQLMFVASLLIEELSTPSGPNSSSPYPIVPAFSRLSRAVKSACDDTTSRAFDSQLLNEIVPK